MVINRSFAQSLGWTRRHMQRTARALAVLPDLSGMRLAGSMHLDIKIAPLIEGLLDRRARIFLVTCNPATVRDQVVNHLRSRGAQVQAWRDMSVVDNDRAIQQALDWGPTHLCELGADLSMALNARHPANFEPAGDGIRAGLEGTGSGITRIQELQIRYPVFNWDDLPVKEGLHNRYMVGLSTWQTFFNRTQLSLHEKQVVVIGYGLVGQGVAHTARAYGGAVTIVERDHSRALQAVYDGWQAASLPDALIRADVIVTCTGASGVLTGEHLPLLKDGVFLLNVGHEGAEIEVTALNEYPHRHILPFIEEFELPGGTVYLIAEGAMANLTAGQGDSLNAFDLTSAILTAGIGFIAAEGASFAPGVHLLPRRVWEQAL
jgi:adenosylhomocysteinase